MATDGEQLSQGLGALWDAGKDFATGVFAAVSNKIHEKHLTGWERSAEEHFVALAGGGPPGKDPNRWGDKWKKDIQKAIRNMRDRLERLKGDKTRSRWEERIRELERRLDEFK